MESMNYHQLRYFSTVVREGISIGQREAANLLPSDLCAVVQHEDNFSESC